MLTHGPFIIKTLIQTKCRNSRLERLLYWPMQKINIRNIKNVHTVVQTRARYLSHHWNCNFLENWPGFIITAPNAHSIQLAPVVVLQNVSIILYVVTTMFPSYMQSYIQTGEHFRTYFESCTAVCSIPQVRVKFIIEFTITVQCLCCCLPLSIIYLFTIHDIIIYIM